MPATLGNMAAAGKDQYMKFRKTPSMPTRKKGTPKRKSLLTLAGVGGYRGE